jgi:hypothetical protein
MQKGGPTPLTTIGKKVADICCRIVVPTLLHIKVPSLWGNVDAISCYFSECEDITPGSASPRTIGSVLRNGPDWSTAPSQVICSTAFALTEAFPEKNGLVSALLLNAHGPFSLVVVACCGIPIPHLCRSLATHPSVPTWILEYAVERAHIKENIQVLMDILDSVAPTTPFMVSRSETDLCGGMGPPPKVECTIIPIKTKVKVPKLLCIAARTIAYPFKAAKQHVQQSARGETHGEKKGFVGYPLKHSKSTPTFVVEIPSPRSPIVLALTTPNTVWMNDAPLSPTNWMIEKSKSTDLGCAFCTSLSSPKGECDNSKDVEVDTAQYLWRTRPIYDYATSPQIHDGIASKTPKLCAQDPSPPTAM